jgi:hypothetical protein
MRTTATTEATKTTDVRRGMGTAETLSLLWIFASLNYIYCDVLGLMDADLLRQLLDGKVAGIDVTPGFLLGSAVLVEIPMAMVVLSRFLAPVASRRANLAAGSVMTAVQVATLFFGGLTVYYAFFSAVEIATTAYVVRTAWLWKPSTA